MQIQNITLYGAGLIGSGWATHLLCCGKRGVVVYDLAESALDRARERIQNGLNFLVSQDILTKAQADEGYTSLVFTTEADVALKDADLIQESCPENLELKRKVLADIEARCRCDAIICTSTSGIMVREIARDAVHPERVIGAHPYHPVYLLPLVEMIRGDKTGEEYMRAAYDFYKSVRKEPVILKKESPGYIASHLMSALFRECVNLISQGVGTMEDIDTAFCYGPGLRYALMGPCTVLQLAGGDHGIAGTLFGGIGNSGGNWLESFANWTVYPPETQPFFQTCQEEMNKEMSHRDALHGRTNAEMELFRDKGLVALLRHHGKL